MPAIFLFFYKNNEKIKIDVNNKYNGRRLFEIIFQPRFLQAIIAAAFAYAVMSFLMTATPLSMHVMEKMSLENTGISSSISSSSYVSSIINYRTFN